MVHGAMGTKIAIQNWEFDVEHRSFIVISASISSKSKEVVFYFMKNQVKQLSIHVNGIICMVDVSIVPLEWQIELSNFTPQQPFWMGVDQGV